MSRAVREKPDQPRDLKGRWSHVEERCKDTIDMFPDVDMFGNDNPQPPRKRREKKHDHEP